MSSPAKDCTTCSCYADTITITTDKMGEVHHMYVPNGEEVQTLIRDAIEEAQMMERT